MRRLYLKDKNIETKVNYFASYYQFVVRQMGVVPDCEIENILSILEKMIFQLENNKPDNRPIYIANHLTNPLIDLNDEYFKQVNTYETLSKKIIECNIAIEKDKKIKGNKNLNRYLKNNEKVFLEILQSSVEDLKQNMIGDAVKKLAYFLTCKHNLERHKKDIEYFTRLITVEAFYNQKSKSLLSELTQRLFYSNFPHSEEFLEKNKANLEEAKKQFMKQRTFGEMFDGLANFTRERKEYYYYIFRVGNITCDIDFSYELENVQFVTKKHAQFQNIEGAFNPELKGVIFDEFCQEGFNLFAIVKDKTKELAFKNASSILTSINNTCEANAYLDRNFYLHTSDFKFIGANTGYGLNIDLSKFKAKLDNFNYSFFFKNKNSNGKTYFLEHEETFIGAENSHSLNGYWTYLENLLGKPFQDTFTKITAQILPEMETILIGRYIKEYLQSYSLFFLSNPNNDFLGLSFEEYKSLMKEIRNSEGFDFESLRNDIDDEFIITLLDYKKELNSAIELDKKAKYIKRIIKELYEERNFIVHSGNRFDKSRIKLEYTISFLLSIFRREVAFALVEHPNKSFQEVIEYLTSSSN